MKEYNSIYEQLKKYNPPNKSINVFMIGLRGYTQNYGGWETFAQGLLNNWKDESIQWWAYEKVSTIREESIVIVNNVICIRVCEKEKGSSAMMRYDKNCTELTCEYVKSHRVNNPIMFHLGVRIGPYLWLKRHYIRNLGIKMVENPAGAEWRRTKWNRLVQVYLYISAIMMAKSTNCMICDNEGIRRLYKKILYGRKPLLEQIAYGVEKIEKVSEIVPNKVEEYFNLWGLKRNEYFLILSRFVPENNYEMMFKGFLKSKTQKKLLVICNYKTELQSFYKHIKSSTGFEKDTRVIMAGIMYDQETLHYIRQYASAYIHGHSVGGTNPGLLEAMSETNVNILYNVDFNRYVGGKAALYFSNEDDLARIIENVDQMSHQELKVYGDKAKYRMEKKYSWEKIVRDYSKVMHGVAEMVIN